MLVPGGGDSRYRFCLHGAAILSTVRPNQGRELYEMFKEIYAGRGRAAHGDRPGDVERVALVARKALADTLLAIVTSILDGHLAPNVGIANAVQRYVLERATF